MTAAKLAALAEIAINMKPTRKASWPSEEAYNLYEAAVDVVDAIERFAALYNS